MSMKTCVGTKSFDGCGKRQDVKQFYIAGRRLDGTIIRGNLCATCTAKFKKAQYNKPDDPEAEFFNQFICGRL